MSVSSFVVWKNWASNPLRTLLTLLGIALGVAIVVAIYVMDHNTIQTRYLLQTPERGSIDLEVMPAQPQPVGEVLKDLRGRAAVLAAEVYREARGTLRPPSEAAGKPVDVQVFGLELGAAAGFDHYVLQEGRDLVSADGENAVLLGAEAARLLGAKVGDRIALEESIRAVQHECRDGQLVALPQEERDPLRFSVEVAGVLEPHRLGRRNFGQVVVVAHSIAQRLGGSAPELFQLRRRYGADLDRLRTELTQSGYVVADERAAQLGEAADERAFRNGLKILGCLALLLGMFVVFQTLSNSLVARVRLLGLLRCLGTSRGAIARIFLGDALALGVVGAGLGLLLGIGLAAALRAANISSLGGSKPWLVFELPLAPMLGTAALGVLFTLAGAAFPLWRARQLPALWILRQRSVGKGGDEDLLRGVNVWLFLLLILVLPVAYLAMTPLVAEEGRETLVVLLQMAGMVAAVGGLLLLAPAAVAVLGRLLLLPLRVIAPLGGWLCGKSLQRQRGRIAASTVGLAAVLLAFLGLHSITASLQGEVNQFADAALEGRAFVEAPLRTAEDCEAWAKLPGVAGVEPIVGEVHGPFLLRGLDVRHVGGKGGALEGDQDRLRRYTDGTVRTLIASRRLATKMGWKVGTLVALRDRNQVPVSYEVLRISDASGYVPSEQAWAIASPEWLRRDFCASGKIVQFTTLRLERKADPSVVGSRLRDLEPQIVRYKTGAEIRGYHLHDVDRDFRLFDLLLFLILVLAGAGLLNGMTIAALARARELGVLRALGVGAGSLRASLSFEGFVVGALGSLLALALAVPMAHVLIAGLNRVAAIEAPVVLPTAWIVAVPVIGIAVGLAAAWLPARRAASQDPATSVRYE